MALILQGERRLVGVVRRYEPGHDVPHWGSRATEERSR